MTNLDNYVSCHDFLTGAGTDNADDITLAPGGGFGLDLQWAQPWGAVRTTTTSSSSIRPTPSSRVPRTFRTIEEPFEFFGYTNTSANTQTVNAGCREVLRRRGPSDEVRDARRRWRHRRAVQRVDGWRCGRSEHLRAQRPATVGSTAAIPYNNANTSEPYSSRGPVTHYYEPTPSTTALGAPDVIAKPDFAATDNVKNVFFGSPAGGMYRFAGTSASVAQAAGIKYFKERNPLLTPAEIMATLAGTRAQSPTTGRRPMWEAATSMRPRRLQASIRSRARQPVWSPCPGIRKPRCSGRPR